MKSINFESLKSSFKGEIFEDKVMRTLYATDASAYREFPLGVVFPQDRNDIEQLRAFAIKIPDRQVLFHLIHDVSTQNETTEIQELKFYDYDEKFMPFVWIAGILLLLEFGLRNTVYRSFI
jgi:hypothetical protein